MSSPAIEAIIEISRSSRGVSGGRMEGRRAASIDFPAPGGPIISMLWPPAAAISSARLALSWPLMSFMSGMSARPERIAGSGRFRTWMPRKWLASEIRLSGATMASVSPAHAASGPQAPGQISARESAFALIAAGSTPATGVMRPSSASSPSTTCSEMESEATAPIATISPSAIGRS